MNVSGTKNIRAYFLNIFSLKYEAKILQNRDEVINEANLLPMNIYKKYYPTISAFQ